MAKLKNSHFVRSVSDKIKAAVAKRDLIRNSWFGIYSCRSADKECPYGSIFLGCSDELALKAAHEVCPTLNVYRVGRFNNSTGKVESEFKPVLLLSK